MRLEAATWVGLAAFVLFHAVIFAVREDAEPFSTDYSRVAVLATHIFAAPAIIRAAKSGLRGQIFSATVVSFVYHFLRLYTDVKYTSWQQLDHGVATGLIVTVFLKYMAHLHSTGIIVLLTALAASFSFGNVLSSALTATVFVGLIAFPCLDVATQRVLRIVLRCVSLGGKVPTALYKSYSKNQRRKLFLAFGLQLLSTATFFIGDYVEGADLYAHALWHAFAYTSLFVLVTVLEEPSHPENVRKPRELYLLGI